MILTPASNAYQLHTSVARGKLHTLIPGALPVSALDPRTMRGDFLSLYLFIFMLRTFDQFVRWFDDDNDNNDKPTHY